MSITESIARLLERVRTFAGAWRGLRLRDRVRELVGLNGDLKGVAESVLRESGIDGRSARDRLRQYFVQHVGEVLNAKELEIVGGISEYGRRIRELRVEEGYAIVTGSGGVDEDGLRLRRDEYILLRETPDVDAARRWAIANQVRRKRGVGARAKLLEYLQSNVGKVVTFEELRYVADTNEWARRIRELRSEEGYTISTHFAGRPDLKPGEYVLEDSEPHAEPHERQIPDAVREAVFSRDANKCQACGWTRDLWTRDDPRHLVLHHVVRHADRGPNDEGNLVVLCNRCHERVHAGELELPGKPG